MFVGLDCKFVVNEVEDVVVAGTKVDEALPSVAFCISLADFFGNTTEDSDVDPGALAASVLIPVGRITDDSWVGCTLPGMFDSADTMAADSDEWAGDLDMDTAT